MDPKKISLLLDIVEGAAKQLAFVAGELNDAKADIIEKECGFHSEVRGHIRTLREKGAS